MGKKKYPGCVKPGFEPFDPVALALWTEGIICKDSMRRYTDFYCTGVYGGISTGYTVGCCLRCIFCWVDFSRDVPDKFGKFYTERKELLKKLKEVGYEDSLEEEICDPYPHTMYRLKEAGVMIFNKEQNIKKW